MGRIWHGQKITVIDKTAYILFNYIEADSACVANKTLFITIRYYPHPTPQQLTHAEIQLAPRSWKTTDSVSVYSFEAFPQFSKSDTPKFSSPYLQYFSGGVGGRDNGIITQMMIIVK